MFESIGLRVLALLFLTTGCGGDDRGQTASDTVATGTSESSGGPVTSSPTSSTTSGDASSGTSGSSTSSADTDTLDTTTAGDTTGTPSECDYETVDGLLVIEAEHLPITEDWEILTSEPGYYAEGFGASLGGETPGVHLEFAAYVGVVNRSAHC